MAKQKRRPSARERGSLAALACTEGQQALDGIADVLDKYGQSLEPETKQELVNAGEQLWDSLVRLGCPV